MFSSQSHTRQGVTAVDVSGGGGSGLPAHFHEISSNTKEVVSLLSLFAPSLFVKWVQRLVLLRYRGRGERLTTHHHLTLRLRTSVAVPPLHLHGVDREEL
jgi:hypothetical protein